MGIIAIIFTIFVAIMVKVTKKPKLTLLLTSGVLLFAITFNFKSFVVGIMDVIASKVLGSEIFYIIGIFIMLYLISEMVIILGLHKNLDTLFVKFKKKNQKISTHILSMFGSNFDLSKIDVLIKFKRIYEQSGFLNQSLNIMSLDMIVIFALMISVFGSNASGMYFLFIATNFFALFWFIKRILDFAFDFFIDYKHDARNIDKQITVTEETNVTYPFMTELIIRFIVYFLITFVVVYLIKVNIIVAGFYLLTVIFIDMFVCAEKFSRSLKPYTEEFILTSVKTAFINVITHVSLLLVGIIYISVISKIFTGTAFISIFNGTSFIILLFLLTILITAFLKDSTLTFILVFPILAMMFENAYNYEQMYFVLPLIGVGIFTEHITVVKITRSKRVIIDFIMQIGVAIGCYILFIKGYLVMAYLLLFVVLLVYIIYNVIVNKRSKK